MRTVVQCQLATDESHLLRKIRTRTRGVEDQLVPHRPAEKMVNGLLPQPAQQVVQCKINRADHIKHKSFTTIEEGGSPHLVPDLLDVDHPGTFEEASEMPLHNPGTRLASRGDTKTNSAVIGLNLDDERTQYIEAEAPAAFRV